MVQFRGFPTRRVPRLAPRLAPGARSPARPGQALRLAPRGARSGLPSLAGWEELRIVIQRTRHRVAYVYSHVKSKVSIRNEFHSLPALPTGRQAAGRFEFGGENHRTKALPLRLSAGRQAARKDGPPSSQRADHPPDSRPAAAIHFTNRRFSALINP